MKPRGKRGQQIERKRGYFDVPFTKTAEDETTGVIEVEGYASTWSMDRDDEMVDPKAFDDSLKSYLVDNPIILYQHNPDWPFGNVSKGNTDDNGLKVKGEIPPPADNEIPEIVTGYNKVKAGVVKTFSIGGWFTRDIRDRALVITEVDLYEISVVSIPANPGSIFDAAVKAFNGEEKRPPIPPRAVAQMKQLLGMESVKDPDLLGLDDGERVAHHAALCEIYRRAGKQAPAIDAWVEMTQGSTMVKVAALANFDKLQAIVEGNVPMVKRGRALSAANEQSLRTAMDHHRQMGDQIQKVLDAVTEDREDEEDDSAPEAGGPDRRPTNDDGTFIPSGLAAEGEPKHVPMSTRDEVAAQVQDGGALPLHRLPLAKRSTGFDPAAARGNVRVWAEASAGPNSKYASAFLLKSDDGTNFRDFHFPVADVIDGELKYVPAGVEAAAKALEDATLSDEERGELRKSLGRLYARMRTDLNDPTIRAPWEASS